MNYLAHAYLSFNDSNLLLGNMISDYVKGKKKFDYPIKIQQGIHLHRLIDEFTDFHPITKEAKQFFKVPYRLYSGAFVDIAYDHFLANDTHSFKDENQFNLFCISTYEALTLNQGLFPSTFEKMFPYMQSQNWLYNYRFTTGIEKSFTGLVKRAAYLTDAQKAIELFHLHYKELNNCFNAFFPLLKSYTISEIEKMVNP